MPSEQLPFGHAHAAAASVASVLSLGRGAYISATATDPEPNRACHRPPCVRGALVALIAGTTPSASHSWSTGVQDVHASRLLSDHREPDHDDPPCSGSPVCQADVRHLR